MATTAAGTIALSSILLIFTIFFCILKTGTSLRCNTCNEKQVGLNWCSEPEEQECDDEESICLKYVYRAGKKNWPNHIIFKCVPRTDYSRSQINACDRTTKKRHDGTVLSYETCTCDSKDLCNDKELSSSAMSDPDEIEQQEQQRTEKGYRKAADNGNMDDDDGHHESQRETARNEAVEHENTSAENGSVEQQNRVSNSLLFGILLMIIAFMQNLHLSF